MATPASDEDALEQKYPSQRTQENLSRYLEKKRELISQYCDFLKSSEFEEISLRKDTSNLFRSTVKPVHKIDVRKFNQVISVDPVHLVAELEGMTPYEDIVRETLKFGCLPTVVPELKSITIGGALAGVGIESSSFRYGLVHETILEFEALLGDGRIVVCRPDNEFKELFYAFPNTYGTLGYALKIKVRLTPVKNFVELNHFHFNDSQEYFDWLKKICNEQRDKETIDFIDGVVFGPKELVVTVGKFVDQVPFLSNYQYMNIYYRSLKPKEKHKNNQHHQDYLSTEDYIWRWDPDWFWCSKHFFMQNFFLRLILGPWLLKSTVFWKIRSFFNKNRMAKKIIEKLQGRGETVIQDIEVPIENAAEFLKFFEHDIGITPIWICPIKPFKTDVQFSFYKMDPEQLYINFGFWDIIPAEKCKGKADGYFNRLIEQKVQQLQGNKSLYSSIYYSQKEFWHIYDHALYGKLKKEYDPLNRLGDLFKKCSSRNP